MSVQIMIVDSQTLVRHGLARLLGDVDGLTVVGMAANGEEALRKLPQAQPQVILLDVVMPGTGGIEFIRRLRSDFPAVSIVAIAPDYTPDLMNDALAAGAVTFITRKASVNDLASALINAFQREPVHRNWGLEGRESPRRITAGGFESLSRRELQVAILCSDGNGVNRISDLLRISPRTVYAYRQKIFGKLGIRSDVELSLLAIRTGLRATGISIPSAPTKAH